MERMQSTWEHRVKYDLSESGVEAMSLEEATRDNRELLRTKLGYAEGVGREPTRALVAAFHPGNGPENVVVTTGTSEANYLTLTTLVSAGDELDGEECTSFSGRGERIVVTGGLSKVYGLPGLRIGWLVAPLEQVQATLRLKDYTTIAPATLSETLAEVALERRDELVKRARYLLNERWPGLEDWATTHSRELHWTPPRAGGVCFFSYRFPIDSMPFVDRLIREYSTMVVPGIHFRAERHLRIGYGMETRVLHAGLAAIDRLLTSLGD